MLTQECILVGCVPPTAIAVGGGGSVSQHAMRQTPSGCGPGEPPPQVWAWRPSLPDPSTPTVGVGLETPSCEQNHRHVQKHNFVAGGKYVSLSA